MEYRVRAHNTATASENKIHDDSVARRLGFGGGLVPGVDVYAYLTHPVVARWGRDWLERGTMHARFLRPVYDGDDVIVTCTADADGLTLEARTADAEPCAKAEASLPEAPPARPDLTAYPEAPLPPDPPRASLETLVPGRILGSLESGFHAEHGPAYLADVRESLALYRERAIAHPGYLLRYANYLLVANVKLGPWIHVESRAQHLGVATDGDRVSTRGRVVDVFERKGHRFVTLDVLLVANGVRPLVQVWHTAIWEPRQTTR